MLSDQVNRMKRITNCRLESKCIESGRLHLLFEIVHFSVTVAVETKANVKKVRYKAKRAISMSLSLSICSSLHILNCIH